MNFELFMFINLAKQTEAWSWVVKGMTDKRLKQIHELALKQQSRFMQELEKEIEKVGSDYVEQWTEDSQIFSNVLEIIRKAETVQKKQELYLIMKEYSEGKLKIIEEE